MGKVVFGTSVSLDSFVAGPNDGPANGLGDGGERLHRWLAEMDSCNNLDEAITIAAGHLTVAHCHPKSRRGRGRGCWSRSGA